MADELKHGKSVVAQMFDSVSVYFSDIVGFTRLASQCSPMEVVGLLNDLYSMFDTILEKHNVYKVCTIPLYIMCQFSEIAQIRTLREESF